MGYIDEDSDDYRLPHGWQRTGYDADTQAYSFKNSQGACYEGEPGCRYGPFHRVSSSVSYDPDGTMWLRRVSNLPPPMKVIPDTSTWTPPERHSRANHGEDEDEDDLNVTRRVSSTLQSLHQCVTSRLSAAIVAAATATAVTSSASQSKAYMNKPRAVSESYLPILKSSHSTSQRSSARSSEKSVEYFRSQSPRDYLLNGPSPTRKLRRWLDEKEDFYDDQDRRRTERDRRRRSGDRNGDEERASVTPSEDRQREACLRRRATTTR